MRRLAPPSRARTCSWSPLCTRRLLRRALVDLVRRRAPDARRCRPAPRSRLRRPPRSRAAPAAGTLPSRTLPPWFEMTIASWRDRRPPPRSPSTVRHPRTERLRSMERSYSSAACWSSGSGEARAAASLPSTWVCAWTVSQVSRHSSSEARAMPRSCSFGTNEEHDPAQEAKALLAARHLGGRIQDRDLLQMGAGDAGTHGVAVSASGLVQTAEMSAEILTSSPTTTPPVSSACCQRSPNSPRLSVPRTSRATRCWP